MRLGGRAACLGIHHWLAGARVCRKSRSLTGRLRSLLREFFPAALTAFPNLATKTALTVLAAAPTPVSAAALTPEQIRHLLRAAGRVGVCASEVERLHQALTAEQLRQPAAVEEAMGVAVGSIVTTVTATHENPYPPLPGVLDRDRRARDRVGCAF
jgi:hypothetical protein